MSNNNTPIYLDYNASTPVLPEVLQSMLPYFTQHFGNASSKTHPYGWAADEAVKIARRQVAQLINGSDTEIVFTSGATEAINLAIKGVFESYSSKGNHIITTQTEHKAVLDCCTYLEKKGARITYLPVNKNGLVDITELENAITNDTILVCVMYTNNETGVIQPVNEIASVIHTKQSIFMCDATQAVGKIPVNVQGEGIDLLCMSAHKMYGPKGVGALYVNRKSPRVTLRPLLHGGGHERGLRSGTLNVPGIAGLGKACEIAFDDDFEKIKKLRDFFEKELSVVGNVSINGSGASRLPNTSNVTFHNTPPGSLIKKLPKFSFSSGSACTSALAQPSHVLKAMGLSDEDCYCSYRFSLGKMTTKNEIEHLLTAIREGLR